MYHQTIRSRHILFHIALCYNYFSNFILFTKDFSISLSVFLFINNINSVFYDNNIHAISSGTLTSQICRFLKSSFSTFKTLIFIVFLSEYHTLYLNLTYDFISKKILAHREIHWRSKLLIHCFHLSIMISLLTQLIFNNSIKSYFFTWSLNPLHLSSFVPPPPP